MTPFDPIALLAMLLAFYPIVSAAAFAQARRERPEYFAGGVIFGSKGDKLRLPDGREWDCIVAAGGPASGRRWSCSLIVDDPDAVPDPFPLEPGPLDPVDEDLVIFPATGDTFASLVAGELEGFGASDDRLHAAAQAATEFSGARIIDGGYERLMVPAREHHAGFVAALPADNPIDELAAAEAHDGVISAESGNYDEPAPADLPEPDPGDPPGDKGGDEGPPPPAF